jgi:beta-N-acetylhexosaminidase
VRHRAATSLVTLLSTLAFAVVLGLSVLGCGSLGGDSGGSASSLGIPSTTTTGGSLPTFRSSTTTSKPAATITIPTSLPPTPADLILRQMTLRQKAAQTLLLAFDGETLLMGTQEILAAGPPGGLLLLSRNVSGADQLRGLNESLQAAAKAVKPGIGLLIAVDQEGGPVQRIHVGVPAVPSARRLARDSDTADAAKLATETAKGLLALGVNMNLAPVADVVSDPQSFLYDRSYGGDPTVVVDFVKVVTGAFERNGLISVVKHFPGHGSASGDSHGDSVVSDASQVDFAKIHFRPFKAAIAAGAEGVMVGHLVANAYDPDHPASSSSRVVGDILSKGLGFSGLIVCDDIEMAGAAGSTPEGATARNTRGEIAVSALAAGCDLIICTAAPSDQMAVVDAIVDAVRTGRLSQSRLDEAVLSMLDIKLRHNLISP